MACLILWCVIGLWIEPKLVRVEHVRHSAPAMVFAVMALKTKFADVAALSAAVAFPFRHFFFNFVRRVKTMVRLASFSKPWTRRIARRSARGLQVFILRLRTHLVPVFLSR